ncbi:hypothetical protein A9Q76_04090 [Arcobacter sp. 31_11_sub10_T18]|nr:hypothetical protein A9Q76_04090 [Arcobacter sp. 31_11_sub10_T18]
MNIELRFLQKAIEDKNFINFTYENQKLSKIKPLKLIEEEGVYTLKTHNNTYDFDKIKRLQISKEKF